MNITHYKNISFIILYIYVNSLFIFDGFYSFLMCLSNIRLCWKSTLRTLFGISAYVYKCVKRQQTFCPFFISTKHNFVYRNITESCKANFPKAHFAHLQIDLKGGLEMFVQEADIYLWDEKEKEEKWLRYPPLHSLPPKNAKRFSGLSRPLQTSLGANKWFFRRKKYADLGTSTLHSRN